MTADDLRLDAEHAGFSLRERLRKARVDAGLTQRELAKRLGVAHSTVSDAERGRANIGTRTFIDWGRACGTSLDWIATGESREPAK